MISSHTKTAREKRWWNWLQPQGCAICGKPAEIHHAAGSAATHNKVRIGQSWVIPLCAEHHRGTGGIHGDLSAFDLWDVSALGETRKEIEKSLFRMYSDKYMAETGRTIPENVRKAIHEYHK